MLNKKAYELDKTKKLVAFIDFEMNTNGDMEKDDMDIIEYGLVITDGTVYKTYRQFVKPVTTDHLLEYTTFVTGIKKDAFKNLLSFERMTGTISYLTKDCDKIYYWGDSDRECLLNEAYKLSLEKSYKVKNVVHKMTSFEDTYIKNRRGVSLVKFAKEVKAVGKDYKQQHRALPDAKLLFYIYKEIGKGGKNKK